MAATQDRHSFSPRRRQEQERQPENDPSSEDVFVARGVRETPARPSTAVPLEESRHARRRRGCSRSKQCRLVTSCIGLSRRSRQMQMPGQVARELADEEVAVRNPGVYLRLLGPTCLRKQNCACCRQAAFFNKALRVMLIPVFDMAAFFLCGTDADASLCGIYSSVFTSVPRRLRTSQIQILCACRRRSHLSDLPTALATSF